MKRLLIFLAVCLTPLLAFALTVQAGPYRVDLTTQPDVLPVGKATLDLYVTDSAGKPVDGAHVRAIAQMPNMAMGEQEQDAVPTGAPGHYRMSQSFSMAGAYEARISVTGPPGKGTAVIAMETGKATSTPAGDARTVWAFWPWLFAAALAAFVLYRMRKTGQQVHLRSIFNRKVVGALFVLGLVLAGAIYAVNHLRRPGAMAPIEAQTMDMDMLPPEGVAPVTLAAAERRPFTASVRYSGQAVGYVEQDVSARTSGVIVAMPSYVGTVVRRGEILVRLDTSQLAPQVAEQSAMVDSARQGVGVAEAEARQSQAMIHQAESELGQFQGALEEAQANVRSARDDHDAAVAQVTTAQADVQDAQARVESAQADQRYWVAEVKREASLFAAGAVSRDEYDKERAEATKSDAALRESEEAVKSTRAKLDGANAGVRKAESGIVAAERKVDESNSALMSHHAHVENARAEAASASAKIAQSMAGVRQAQAGLQSVTAQAGYAEIRAEADGVVTQRLISPGTLVSPGQAILRVAQISPIRIQANVPEADLGRVRVGARVSNYHGEAGGRPTFARVTSVSPSVDPVSRTGIVEAVLPNPDRAFLPGQFVSMEISVGPSGAQVTVPTEAIQTGVSGGDGVQSRSSSAFVWVANPAPGHADRFTVARRDVELGNAQGDRTTIPAGLDAGDRVVVTGADGLSDGQTVVTVAAAAMQMNMLHGKVIVR